MKIAIQGHSTRGKEVIQILKSLGGKNTHKLCGNGKDYANYYHIDNCGIIAFSSKCYLCNYKFYTLEEFEKEFPFKVGDKVRHISSTCIIKEYGFMNNKPVYVVKSTELGILATIPVELLTTYEKMKEERNITLTLDKAKEWYKKGGELREIALQAFTEKELNPLPRSWEEFITNRSISGYYISGDEKPLACCSSGKLSSPHVCPSKKSAEAHLAMIQLEQLRDCWRQGWEPDWSDEKQAKCYICYYQGKFKISTLYETRCFLSFPTYEMAKEFLKCFRDLIEKAGDLI